MGRKELRRGRERENSFSGLIVEDSHVPRAPSQRGLNPGHVSVSEKTEARGALAACHGDQEKFHCLLHLPPSHSGEFPSPRAAWKFDEEMKAWHSRKMASGWSCLDRVFKEASQGPSEAGPGACAASQGSCMSSA